MGYLAARGSGHQPETRKTGKYHDEGLRSVIAVGTVSEGAARTPLCARLEVEDAHDQWDPLVSEREQREVRLRGAILIV